MVAFVLSNLVGLLRQTLVLRVFGTGPDMAAFNYANTIPDVLFNLIAGGALASTFLPIFTDFLARDDRAGAWKLASAVINLAVLALSTASALTALFAPTVVRYGIFALYPTADPALQDQTAALLRILLIAPSIFGVSGLMMGILNAHQKFWLAALAPAIYWVGWILGLIFFVPSLGIYGLAWGYVLGALLHLGIQLPDLLRLAGRRYYPTFGLGNPAVREVARLMGPRLLGVAAVQLNFVINAMISAGLGQASLTAIKVAFMVMTMPLYVIAQSIATAALPTFSAQVARGKLDEMRASLASTLRGVLLLAVPATLGLALLREPVTAMLFQYGAFDANSTEIVAWALLWYTVGLPGHSLVEILSRAFYALHDTKTPVIVGTLAMTLNAVFSFIFPGMFQSAGWLALGGLALANSLATALEAATLLFLMRRRLDGIHGAEIARGAAQSGLAALGMALALWAWVNIAGAGHMGVWIIGLGGVMIGGLVYSLGVLLLKIPEADAIIQLVKRKLSGS